MGSGDFDSLDFISFQADASRNKVKHFTRFPWFGLQTFVAIIDCALSSATSLEGA